MRSLFVLIVFALCAAGEVRIEELKQGWVIDNGKIRLELSHAAAGQVRMASLRSSGSSFEWAAPGGQSPVGIDWIANPTAGSEFRFRDAHTKQLAGGGKELAVGFEQAKSGAKLALRIRCYPDRAVLEYAAGIDNGGAAALPLIRRIAPLVLSLAPGPELFTSDIGGAHGLRSSGKASGAQTFSNWVVLRQGAESMLIGGDLGAGVLNWQAAIDSHSDRADIHAGVGFPKAKRGGEPAFELAPGDSVETPISFLALSKGDADDAANEASRYLKQQVFPKPLPNAPLAAYCIWFTVPKSEDYLLDELRFAQRMGFDVFYHDASWYEGSSLVPGTNDWASGLGSYRESPEKFPSGMKHLSEAVRAAGLKFGLWVDPGNVDSARVKRGEIPEAWLAKIDGEVLEGRHPSLAPMTTLCLGNPAVVAAIKKNLSHVIEDWNLEWIKWDPSGTVSQNCNRTDHGHTAHNGAYAGWRGKMEIWSYLRARYPQLSGFECDPSLSYSRTNPGPRTILPGGYETEFITGPMVSPQVWGSPYSAKGELNGQWYSASALDYDIRKHFMHGFVFGNIDGMLSQRLSVAPPGYIEAFRRNLLWFKNYRHLLTEDVYHPVMDDAGHWSAIQYVSQDGADSVVFVFRNGGQEAINRFKPRGLIAQASYEVTNLNDRPGRERNIRGDELVEVKLPDEWLAKGDGLPSKQYEDQLTYGSAVIRLRRK